MGEWKASVIVTASAKAAAAAVGAVGGAARGSVSALRSMTSAGATAFKSMFAGLAQLNQVVELFGRAWQKITQVVGETIDASLKFRDAGDPARKFFEDMQRESEQVKAKIGDILIPIIKGFGQAAAQAGLSVSKWLEQHRKMIAMGIVEWVGKLGNLLISVVARGASLATKAWLGINASIQFARMVAARFFELVVSGWAKNIELAARAARAIGADGVAGKLEEAAGAVRGFQDSIRESGDESQAELERTAAAIVAVDKSIESAEATARKLLATGISGAMREIAKDAGSGKRSIDDLNAALERTEKLQAAGVRGMKAAAQEARAYWEQQADAAERAGKAIDAAMEERGRAFANTAMELSTTLGQVWGEMLAQQAKASDIGKEVAKTAIANTLQMVNRIVMAYAVEAAAAQFAKSSALGPGIGIAIGAAAASTVFGLVEGLLSKMASGGEVRGGINGRDSVLALLEPGERVFSVRENRMLKSLMHSVSQPRADSRNTSGLPAFAGGGIVGRPAPSSSAPARAGSTFNVSLQMLDAPSSRTQRRKVLLNFSRELEELVSDRLLLRNLPAARTV